MKLVKRLISKLWLDRGVQARWWGEESKERKRAEGLSESRVGVRQGRGLGLLSSGLHMAQGLVKVPQWQSAKNQRVPLESPEKGLP